MGCLVKVEASPTLNGSGVVLIALAIIRLVSVDHIGEVAVNSTAEPLEIIRERLRSL